MRAILPCGCVIEVWGWSPTYVRYPGGYRRVEEHKLACLKEFDVRKREKRIQKELNRIGTDRAGSGWASRQASKRHNSGRRLSKRAINRHKA